jgi:signal transduction histidine kinase
MRLKARLPSPFSESGNIWWPLIIVFILGWGFIAGDLDRVRQRAFAHARIQLDNLTNVYAEEVSSSIEAINYVLIDLREEWKNNPERFDALVQFRQDYLDPSVAFNVGIIDAQGQLAFATAARNASKVNLRDREHFSFHIVNERDQLHISKPVLLRAAHRLAIQFSRSLPKKDGIFNGVIVVSVSPEYFSRFHENIDLGKNSSITLARINGDLIARSPRPGQAVDTTIQEAPWVGAQPSESGFFQKYSEVDGIERLYAWRVLESGDLAVIMGQSVEAILAPYHQQRVTYLWWGTSATLLLLLAAYFMGRNRLQRAKANAAVQRMEKALASSQKLESIGQLTGGVTHDFNNILHIISSNIQLLEITAKGNKQIEPYLESIASAIERGSKLAAQLLTFARRQPLQPTTVDIEKLIKDIDSLIQRLVGDGIEVKVDAPRDIWKVYVDPSLLENVILNLAANARDAMNSIGTLNIKLANEPMDAQRASRYPGIGTGNYVSLAITDTGSGMPPEVMERAFEPFYTTKPEGKGTGLGLAMAYGFIKESGGHIHINSTLGQGTTIQMFLPRSLEE